MSEMQGLCLITVYNCEDGIVHCRDTSVRGNAWMLLGQLPMAALLHWLAPGDWKAVLDRGLLMAPQQMQVLTFVMHVISTSSACAHRETPTERSPLHAGQLPSRPSEHPRNLPDSATSSSYVQGNLGRGVCNTGTEAVAARQLLQAYLSEKLPAQVSTDQVPRVSKGPSTSVHVLSTDVSVRLLSRRVLSTISCLDTCIPPPCTG